MLAKRQDEERVISEDDSISGQAKSSKIRELRISMLGECNNESEKFKKDVYSCSYLNFESDAIKKMQEKIKLDAYKK